MHLTCLKRKIRIIVFKTELSIPLLSKAIQRLNAKIILCDKILCVTRYVIRISFVICSEILCNSCCNNEVIDYFPPRQSICWSHAIARSCTEVLMLWGNDPAMIIPISNLIKLKGIFNSIMNLTILMIKYHFDILMTFALTPGQVWSMMILLYLEERL